VVQAEESREDIISLVGSVLFSSRLFWHRQVSTATETERVVCVCVSERETDTRRDEKKRKRRRGREEGKTT